ncbi:MAG: two-component system, NarL family, sensor histidine kinase DesK [Acidimicrobiaceae bacterium]|nr:two-component system, NarL family, sensor histidine kinase DesK [Acidimicrobiaceae bacterium]
MTALFPKVEIGTGPGRPETTPDSLRRAFPSHRPGFSPFFPDNNPGGAPIRPLAYILFGPSGRATGRGGDAVGAAGEVPERRRRGRMVAWSSAWLIVLAAPGGEIVQGQDHPAAVAVGILAAFVGLYVTLLWLATDPTTRRVVKVALLAPLTALALVGSLAFHQSWPFMFFFLSVAAASALPENRAVFGIAAVTALDAVVVTRPALSEFNPGPQIFGVFMAGLLVMFITRLLRLIAELNAAREELARMAVADERLRFARDLHDLLGHTLSLIVVKSEAVRRLVHHDADAAARESGDIELVSRQALAEVREAVTNYRERSLEDELEGARLALTAAGIVATIHQSDERLPDTIESVLGWTVREGVTNVVRHSNGHHCDIDVRQVDGVAVLQICDDGDPGRDAGVRVPAASGGVDDATTAGAVGAGAGAGAGAAGGAAGGSAPGAARAGTGLRGLAERLAAAHGRLEAGRRPDGGFRLAVSVPLEPDRAEPV